MCGITGIHGRGDSAALTATHNMTAALAHRGPDAEGHWTDEQQVVLGHRRLSILDTSEGANQPMESACGRYVIAFNGEVYNYVELRTELTDYPFRTSGDTEVVLAALKAWGTDALSRFNGMFAFALWDRQEERLLLARDRMGIKPLYLFQSDNQLLWASEVRALLASERIPRRLDRGGLVDFLRYQTVHGPGTLIEGVEMLPAGHLLWADDNEVTVEPWWDAATAGRTHAEAGEPWTYAAAPAQQRVRELLMDSVRLRMRSDVPFGAFLSGGIDSSAVVALMTEVGDRRVSTFNVAFQEDAFDESQYARVIAEKFNTEHHEIRLSVDDFLEAVPDALAATDHPSGDGPNTYVVSQATKTLDSPWPSAASGGTSFLPATLSSSAPSNCSKNGGPWHGQRDCAASPGPPIAPPDPAWPQTNSPPFWQATLWIPPPPILSAAACSWNPTCGA